MTCVADSCCTKILDGSSSSQGHQGASITSTSPPQSTTTSSSITTTTTSASDVTTHSPLKPLNIMLCHHLLDHQLRILCRPPPDGTEFSELLNQITIKVIDFGHPGQFCFCVLVRKGFCVQSQNIHILTLNLFYRSNG
jgi:hypothetical protein